MVGIPNGETTKPTDGPAVPEGASSLLGLFAPPSGSVEKSARPAENALLGNSRATNDTSAAVSLERQLEFPRGSTIHRCNSAELLDAGNNSTSIPFLPDSTIDEPLDSPKQGLNTRVIESEYDDNFGCLLDGPILNENTPLLVEKMQHSTSIGGLFDPLPESKTPIPPHNEVTPKAGHRQRKTLLSTTRNARTDSALPPIIESVRPSVDTHNDDSPEMHKQQIRSDCWQGFLSKFWQAYHECLQPTTWVGAFMFLLYQIVFCLTMGSAITRPHSTVSLLGLLTKMSALGIILGAPVYWYGSGTEIPALYPTVDLFSAPFLAEIAVVVDNTLFEDKNVTCQENDALFLGTFTFLASVALFLSGTLLVLASVFKLANLGAFLPFPVLCGFFAAVGVLTWTLAFKVDTNGLTVHEVVFSGDAALVLHSLRHHLPSVFIAAIMKYLGPKNPFYVAGVVLATICMFYIFMLSFGVSMEQMIECEWFWARSDLVYESLDVKVGFAKWAPPAPMGWISSFISGNVHWGAVQTGLNPTVALAFLYMIRCSLHGAALKKNVPNLERIVKGRARPKLIRDRSVQASGPRRRRFSEVVDIENLASVMSELDADGPSTIHPKPTHMSLKDILIQYGYSQYVCGLMGSFAITPSVAASPTMYMLGAEGVAPQLGSVLLLSLFYLTDFQAVSYIPKPAFSSLLVLAFIDMTSTWFVKSYFKTKEKMEWLVVPLIVLLAFVVGLLGSVFLGIAMSTFLFVAAFFRSGVVKYVANGIAIRSTIERPLKTANWLDRNGELIQILVLQNYLFFGNASSILNYICSMFEDPDPALDEVFVVPIPKIIVLDLTLVTGIDTSAVDVFSDIFSMVGKHNCKLFLSGVSNNLRQVMAMAGVKPESSVDRKKRQLRFFSNLDTAIGKAEDMLLDDAGIEEQSDFGYTGAKGFALALWHIDDQHDTKYAKDLMALKDYTIQIEVEPGEMLYEDKHLDRGLFFIEHGIMRIERNANFTLSRVGSTDSLSKLGQTSGTISCLNARSASIGREVARLKMSGVSARNHMFRVARIGPGWVLGSIEALSGAIHPGSMIAVTQCRLHYISYKKIEDIERSDPLLVLTLHKLLSYLMARRQSVTIHQLATLHSIMSSPAQKKPIGRAGSSGFHMS